ncbi:MAG TPA: histidine phosphatase family protein [Pyrinomonadaceae bacterium]|nr:histidine phosphatase family protein [Pyrinomonadaceae bacterium]
MSNVYFIRHGQAGTREAYDTLSGLGRRQARLLGEYLVSQGVEFAAAYAGGLLRQQQTAAEVAAAYAEAGHAFPRLSIDAGWDEFDFHRVYREIAPLMCEDDEEFRHEHEQMLAEARASADDHGAEVHRLWRASDTKVMDAWVAGRYPYAGESWEQFIARVAACRLDGTNAQPRPNVAVFTSAVPTAIWTARALEASNTHIPRLAAVLLNTAYTVLQLREAESLLITFNAVPHLHSAELRTRR